MFPPLPKATFDVIYADPPWRYNDNKGAAPVKGVALDHYPDVSLADLQRLDVPRIAAKDCLLLMWTANPKMDDAIALGTSWGFLYRTVAFYWHKTAAPVVGYYTMSSVEPCLAFRKGRIPKPRGSRSELQYIRAPQEKHSRKPDEARRRIERMFPRQSKIELFARQRVAGWHSWGNEA